MYLGTQKFELAIRELRETFGTHIADLVNIHVLDIDDGFANVNRISDSEVTRGELGRDWHLLRIGNRKVKLLIHKLENVKMSTVLGRTRNYITYHIQVCSQLLRNPAKSVEFLLYFTTYPSSHEVA